MFTYTDDKYAGGLNCQNLRETLILCLYISSHSSGHFRLKTPKLVYKLMSAGICGGVQCIDSMKNEQDFSRTTQEVSNLRGSR